MKASLRSVRIAPKKANLIAGMVRGLTVEKAIYSLEHTNKKAARLLEQLVKSAMANAEHNDNQNPENLVIKSLIVNKAQAYHRGVPMARGRVRPMRKFLSHITLILGVAEEKSSKKESNKTAKIPSQAAKKPVKTIVKSEESKSVKETATSDSVSANSNSPK